MSFAAGFVGDPGFLIGFTTGFFAIGLTTFANGFFAIGLTAGFGFTSGFFTNSFTNDFLAGFGTSFVPITGFVIAGFTSGFFMRGFFAADGFFGSRKHLEYDAILAMYHDQGLIPFKTLTFGSGVNFTAGLNEVRTSPDHGTAFDIAGEGKADFKSFLQAILYARSIFLNRRQNLV